MMTFLIGLKSLQSSYITQSYTIRSTAKFDANAEQTSAYIAYLLLVFNYQVLDSSAGKKYDVFL